MQIHGEKKMIKYITENVEISPDSFNLESSDKKKQFEYSKNKNAPQIKPDQCFLVTQDFFKINIKLYLRDFCFR